MMMEKHLNFTATTGFGRDEEVFLVKNAVCFHLYESGHRFFKDLWLESIWEVFVLYWPPADQSDNALAVHREALHWIYKHLDPETHQTEQASIQFPQVYYPGPTKQCHTTISPLLPRQPLNINQNIYEV
ncbi:hypothetical protein IW261DRAFT_1421114 [Armillaria novae-zelandiae]|uniref:Uncharacterized protein n=1 Tax=Armillaria novae-zelandiae TaxID=153914 RepID=A0AA39P4G4_9AGAR|nr:hypothetical protein IW261DRAFT_1421114 [Armillaria novae-zelandiae]